MLVHNAALICEYLFAAIDIPIPVPQNKIPQEFLFFFNFSVNKLQ